ncbi:MAG: ELKS/Rab6-interacting/CAST family protein [Planctomycetes bacterium]|nr:ELKS/Rab6-interacting/CAST family protein [Planctomycetota bacterium]
MPDSIVFRCTSCKKAYKVGGQHAGRNFQCTNCQAHIVVPTTSTNSGMQVPLPENFAPEVDMNAGSEVVFKQTDSQRRASIAPTRVFSNQRDTGLTQPSEVKSGGKGALIAVILAVVIVGGGVAAFFLMNNAPNANNSPTVADNSEKDIKAPNGGVNELRDKLLEESSKSDVTPARLLKILAEARTAKLPKSVIAELTDRAVAKIYDENGSGVPNAKIFVFASELEDADKQSDANQMYSVIVSKEASHSTQTDDLKRAHQKLGNTFFDFAKSEELVRELLPWSGFLELDDLQSELDALIEKSKDGWMKNIYHSSAKEFESDLKAHAERLEEIKKESPYLSISAPIEAAFRQTRLGKSKDWFVVAIEPIVCIAEASIDKDATVELIDKMVHALNFYKKEFVEPLGLKRLQPANLETQEERDTAPFIVFLFDDRDAWIKYLNENTVASVDTDNLKWFTEYDNGRYSSYFDNSDRQGAQVLATFKVLLMDHYHPRVPTKRVAKGTMPNRFTGYMINKGITRSFSATSSIENEDGELVPHYFAGRKSTRAKMSAEKKPFKWEGTRANNYGGILVNTKQIITSNSDSEVAEFIFENVEKRDWNEEGMASIKKIFYLTILVVSTWKFSSVVSLFSLLAVWRSHWDFCSGAVHCGLAADGERDVVKVLVASAAVRIAQTTP